VKRIDVRCCGQPLKLLGTLPVMDAVRDGDPVRFILMQPRVRDFDAAQGGTNTEMVAVNEAWQVLGDDKTRKHYDQTGENSPPSVELRAHQQLTEFFAAALSNDHVPLLVAVGQMLDMQQAQAKQAISQNGHKVVKLTARRDKIKTKAGKQNLVHQLIDHGILVLNAQIAEAEEILVVNAAARVLAANYESEEDAGLIVPRGPVFRAGSFTGGFHNG
jgi:hypothetical protein